MQPQQNSSNQNQEPAPQPSSPVSSPAQANTAPAQSSPLTKTGKIKRFFFQVMIGCLLASAGIAVITVLAGSFNDVLGRSLGTIAMVAVHALLSFSYISGTEKRSKQIGYEDIDTFSNVVFGLIAASFITSILAIWQVLDGEFTFRLYMLYGVILFATLHADALYRIRHFDKKIDMLVTTNYFFMSVVVAMLSFVIFVPSPSDLGEVFYRILAAAGIVDATMTITVIIMHKMYLQKHPELIQKELGENVKEAKKIWHNPFIVILIIFLVLQIIGALFSLIIGAFA